MVNEQHMSERRAYALVGPENWYWGENGELDDREAYIDALLKADGV
jgi:hypothetical protein